MNITHIIAAAGSGHRFGAPLPKQFCDLEGRPLLMTTIERLRRATPGARLILVLNDDYKSLWLDMCREHGFFSPEIVSGGDTRWASVKNALAATPPDTDIITVHDGARPAVSSRIVNNVVAAIESGHHGALPMIPITDSVRTTLPDGTTRHIDRSLLRAVQTPQAFNARLLRKAYELPFNPLFTDDASVMEAAGYSDIASVEGDFRNIKVTRPGDMEIAAIYLKSLADGESQK